VHRGSHPSPDRHRPFFDRAELQRLLALYAERVAEGVWRDYAIDRQRGGVAFCVFRSSGEMPLYSVRKPAGGGPYEVYDGPRRVKRTGSLDDALHELKRRSAVRPVT